MYYTLCFGNCCPLQPSAKFCVLRSAKKDMLHWEPRCVPDCVPVGWGPAPHSKDWQLQLVPAGCLPGGVTGGLSRQESPHPTESCAGLTNGWATPPVNQPASSVFLEGSGWVPVGLFPKLFILWKRQEVLWSSGLPMPPDVWMWGVSIILGPPSLGHLLLRQLSAAWPCELTPALPATPPATEPWKFQSGTQYLPVSF